MSIRFTFPNDRLKFESIIDSERLKQRLQKQNEQFGVWYNRFRIEKRLNSKYIYAHCVKCTANLRYKWNEALEVYELKIFNNQHQHENEDTINHELTKFIKQLPFSIELATARKIATNRFNVTDSKFYHMYSKIKQTRATIPQLIKQLQSRDYEISLDPFPLPEGELPRIIVLVSPLMKKKFQMFGQCVCYDLTYNVIQETHQNRQYAIGIFTGVNCYNRIIPFGISITCQQKTQSICKILESFIESAGQPRSFITDEQPSIIAAINRLQQTRQFSGTHLFDSFHVIRNYGKMAESRDILGEVSEVIKEHDPNIFKFKLEELKNKMKTQGQLKAFHLFYQKIKNVCFSQIPANSFVIFNASNSINEKMNDLIKSRIRSQKPYSQVLKLLVQLCQKMYETSESSVELYDFRIEDIFEDYQLRLCRYILAKRPMQQFIKQYVSSLSLKPPYQQGEQKFIFEQERTVSQCAIENGISCSCAFTQKTGICCKHMIWVCRLKKVPYVQTIDDRWKFEKQHEFHSKKRSNRATRRRRH